MKGDAQRGSINASNEANFGSSLRWISHQRLAQPAGYFRLRQSSRDRQITWFWKEQRAKHAAGEARSGRVLQLRQRESRRYTFRASTFTAGRNRRACAFGALAAEAEDGLAFLHQVEAVAGDGPRYVGSFLSKHLRVSGGRAALSARTWASSWSISARLVGVCTSGGKGRRGASREHEQDARKTRFPDSPRRRLRAARGSGRTELHLAHLTAVDGVVTQFFFDAEKLVVLRDAIGAAERAGLDLAGVGRHGDVGDGGVFGLAGAMADDGGVAVFLGEFDGVERLGERADLVDLHEDRVGHAAFDALAEEFDVGHEEIVADELGLRADRVGELLPAVPVVFRAAVFDGDDRVLALRAPGSRRPALRAVRFEPSDFLKTYWFVPAS